MTTESDVLKIIIQLLKMYVIIKNEIMEPTAET